jgi:F-type H+-transporting ATPase subunit delta
MEQRVALRYAQALLDIGIERNVLERISQDMQTLEESLEASKELRHALASPVIRPDIKRKLLHELFDKHLHPEVLMFLDLLVKKGRAEVIAGTARQFHRLLDRRNGVVVAHIKSAIELDQSTQKIITEKVASMTGKRVTAMFSVDPSVKGGFVARVEDTLIDASLAHQLEILRNKFRSGEFILN